VLWYSLTAPRRHWLISNRYSAVLSRNSKELIIKLTHKRAFKLARTFISPYKKAVAGALAALIFTAGVTLGLGQGLRILVDQGLATQSPAMLSQSIGLFFVLVIALAFGSFARFYLVSWIGERVIADIRKQVFNHLIDLHPRLL